MLSLVVRVGWQKNIEEESPVRYPGYEVYKAILYLELHLETYLETYNRGVMWHYHDLPVSTCAVTFWTS